MPSIYDLNEQQRELQDAIFWLDPDDESYEQDKAEIEAKLSRIIGNAQFKLEYVAKIYLDSKAVLEQRIQARKLAQKREKQAQAATDRLHQFLLDTMAKFDIKKVDAGVCNISRYLSSGSVVYSSEFSIDTLPDKYVKLIPETKQPITSEISKALKDGEFIEGCELVKSDVIRIS